MNTTKLLLGSMIPLMFAFGCAANAEVKLAVAEPPPPAAAVAPAAAPAAPAELGEAKIKGDHIEIAHQIQFDTDSDHIDEAKSKAVLHDLLEIMRAHAEVTHVLVEGHTDERGAASHNQDLSNRRAGAVATYLNSHGLTSVKFEAKGHGSAKPLCKEDTKECHDSNRRVEFTILK